MVKERGSFRRLAPAALSLTGVSERESFRCPGVLEPPLLGVAEPNFSERQVASPEVPLIGVLEPNSPERLPAPVASLPGVVEPLPSEFLLALAEPLLGVVESVAEPFLGVAEGSSFDCLGVPGLTLSGESERGSLVRLWRLRPPPLPGVDESGGVLIVSSSSDGNRGSSTADTEPSAADVESWSEVESFSDCELTGWLSGIMTS